MGICTTLNAKDCRVAPQPSERIEKIMPRKNKTTPTCCYNTLNEIHDLVAQAWRAEAIMLATPCILIIPKLNPAPTAAGLLAGAMKELGSQGIGVLTTRLKKNKEREPFVEAVQNMYKLKYWGMLRAAGSHATLHARDFQLCNFWQTLATTYSEVFNQR